jgi:hypothetical protein
MRPLHLLSIFSFLSCASLYCVEAEEGIAQPAAETTLGTVCPSALSIEQFRAYGLRFSAEVAEIDQQYAQELARAFDTEVLSNPELQLEQTYTSMKINGDNDPQVNAALAQPLKLSNFGAKARVAALMRTVGDTQKRAKLLEFDQKLLVQFYSLHVLQETEKILRNAMERSSQKVALVSEGVKKGLLSAGDEKLFEGEKYRIMAQANGVQSNLALLRGEISRTLGIPCLLAVKGSGTLAPLPSEDELLAKAKMSSLSEVVRLELLENLAHEQRRLAQRDAYPEIAPRIVYQHTNDGGDFLGVGVTARLPVWNRNQSGIMTAEADERAAQRRRSLLADGGLAWQIKSLREAVQSAGEQSTLYRTKVVPAFQESLAAQERLYSQGKGSVIQVWQSLRALNEAQLQELSLIVVAISARTQLSMLIGEEV